MNRILIVVAVLVLVVGIILYEKKNGESGHVGGTSGTTTTNETYPATSGAPGATGTGEGINKANKEKGTVGTVGTGATNAGATKGTTANGTTANGVSPTGAAENPSAGMSASGGGGGESQVGGESGGGGEPRVGGAPKVEGAVPNPEAITNNAKIENAGKGGLVAQPGDDGESPPPAVKAKAKAAASLAGVSSPEVWLVAADLKKVAGAKKSGNFEIGDPDASKATVWKNREGSKLGDGVRAKGGTTATFVRQLATTAGPLDAVALCGPGVKECVNSQPSQIKFGLDINHPDGWLAGSDHRGKSQKGGSSFTALFVAARGAALANPLLENQNGEGAATKGPFLGWIGPDLVGSIHGLEGIVGENATALPSAWTSSVHPEIYTLRFDRKKSELKLFLVANSGSATRVQTIEKNDGPDNDQYASIAMGSKNPGTGAATYVFEAAAFSRALTDHEICSIHKDWNKRYRLNIPASQLKPCSP